MYKQVTIIIILISIHSHPDQDPSPHYHRDLHLENPHRYMSSCSFPPTLMTYGGYSTHPMCHLCPLRLPHPLLDLCHVCLCGEDYVLTTSLGNPQCGQVHLCHHQPHSLSPHQGILSQNPNLEWAHSPLVGTCYDSSDYYLTIIWYTLLDAKLMEYSLYPIWLHQCLACLYIGRISHPWQLMEVLHPFQHILIWVLVYL